MGPYRKRLTEEEILSIASSIFHSKPAWINWIATPNIHRFLTFCESSIKFYGADFCAQKKQYVLDVFIHYRNKVTDGDYIDEQRFEHSVRAMGEFEKEHGYNNADSLFFTHYMFNIEQYMETFDE